jgi:hypothetical protein
MNTIFNEMSIMILKEGKKADCCDDYDHDFCVSDFEDTLKDLDKTQMTYTIDSIPILKQELGDEEGCCEAYLIEYDMLNKLIESYEDINNEFEAYNAVCEYYNLDSSSLIVVFESDVVAKGLLDTHKEPTSYSIMKAYSKTIKGFINKGIRCCKKA